MDAVLQKIKADITSRPLVSILIVITIIAASTLFTLALATLMNISAPYDRSFQELNGAHLWLYFDRDKIRSRDTERIEALPGVVESTGLQYSITSRVRIHDTRVWTSLRVMPVETPAVNRLLIQEGRYLAPRQTEILASKDLNDLYHLSVGDTVGVTRLDGKKMSLPVIGLAYNPMWDTYRNSQPPYLYISEETKRELFPDESTWDWSMGLCLADPESGEEMLAQIEAMLRPDAIASHTDWRDVRESAIFGAQLNFVFLGAFGLFAILATVLVIASSISSSVLSQFRQIGILKAIGFTQNQILSLYLGQYLVLGLIGSPAGLLLGIVLSPLPLKSVAASLSTTFQPPVNLLLIALVLGIIPGIIVAATLGAAHRGAKVNIIKAIATGAEAPRKKSSWVVRLATQLGFPMASILGLNDVFVRPFRSFITGLNLTLGVIGIIFGLALDETLETYRENPHLLGIVYDAVVTREETSDSHTQRILRGAPGVEAFYSEYLVDVETQQGQSFQVRAVEGNLAAFPFRISEGRFFQLNTHEATAGQGLLDWLGLTVGDELTLILDDKDNRPTTWRIVGRYPEPANAGQMLMVSLPTVARVQRRAEPRTYYLKLAPDADTAQLKQYLEPRPDADLNLTLIGQAIPGAVFYLQLAIFALAGILIVIALINVFNTSLLAVQEKLRVVGVLKTLGMTPAQVVAMVNTTAGFLGLLAAGVGIPLGLAFTRAILATLSSTYGFGEVNVTLSLFYVLLLIPLMVVVSMAGSVIPGWWAARLSIVQVYAMNEYLRQSWSRSRSFRLILVVVMVCTLLRLAVHGVYLAMMWSPGQGMGGQLPEWVGAEGPMIPADLQIYLDAAKHFQLRQGLYLKGSLARLEDHYPYAPSFALAFIPSLWLPLGAVAVVHTLLHIVAYVLLYVWWGRIFRRLGLERANEMLAWTLPVWLVFSAFWGDLGYLNIYIIMALLGTLLIDAIQDERLGWSLLWLSIILQIKPHWAFAAALPLLLGRYRFFLKLVALAILSYAAIVGVTILVAGPAYGWQQHVDYVQFLARLSRDFPWRGPDSGFMGYNHSIVQIVVYLLGVTPGAMRLATGIKVLLLAPLAVVALRHLFRPAGRPGRDVPRQSLDFAFALYLGAFIWLDMVWEVSLGIAVFTYLLATLERQNTHLCKILVWAVFLPYALVDFWQLASFAVFGMDVIAPGPYILTDPSIYIPLVMIVILTFYALLVRRLWVAVPARQAVRGEWWILERS